MPKKFPATETVANPIAASRAKFSEERVGSGTVPHCKDTYGGKANADLALEFGRLASQWKKETAYHSSMGVKANHPAYRKILEMGERAIPLILADLKRSRELWFHALRSLTGANPVPSEHRGQVEEMVNAWLEWGRNQGYGV